MIAAELHCHSTFSKGTKIQVEGLHSPEELLEQAEKIGLDVLAFTDHDCFEGAEQALKLQKKFNVLVLPGEEVTTKKGHLLCLGIQEKIPANLSVEESIDLVHEQGGIAIAPHPFDIEGKGIKVEALKADAIEVFNALNLDRFANRKASQFAKQENLPTVLGSDAHCKEMIGLAINNIKAEKDVDAILKAIKKGNVEVKQKKYVPTKILQNWSVQRLKTSNQYVKNYINKHYSFPKKQISKAMLKLVDFSPGKIDYFFTSITYLGLGSAIIYSAIKNLT